MFERERLVFAFAVKAGPTPTIATTAGAGAGAGARGVTVTTEAGVTRGGPGGSLLSVLHPPWARGMCGDGRFRGEGA